MKTNPKSRIGNPKSKMSPMSLLRIDSLRAGYGPIEVLKGISLEVGVGEIVTIIGANGAGKTTTLMCVSGGLGWRAGRGPRG